MTSYRLVFMLMACTVSLPSPSSLFHSDHSGHATNVINPTYGYDTHQSHTYIKGKMAALRYLCFGNYDSVAVVEGSDRERKALFVVALAEELLHQPVRPLLADRLYDVIRGAGRGVWGRVA